jgi:hypothetical protein
MTIFLALAATVASQAPEPSQDQGAARESQAESTYADLDAGIGYSTNPRMSSSSSTDGRGFGRLAIRGFHTRRSERSNLTLSAYVENTTYTGNLPSDQIAQLSGHYDVASSEKVHLFADVVGSIDRGGQLGTRLLGVPEPTAEPPENSPPPLPGTSFDYFSLSERIYRISAQAGAQITSSLRDSWTVRGGYQYLARRGSTFARNESDVFGSVGYNRRVSERAVAGFLLSAEHADFSGPAQYTVVSPQVTASVALSPRTQISGGAGVSISHLDTGTQTRNSVGFAGNLSICHSGDKDQLCAAVSRDQQTTTAAGVGNALAAQLTYSRRLSRNDSLQIALSAARYSQGLSPVNPDLSLAHTTSFLGSVGYNHAISNRWSVGTQLAARTLSTPGPDPKADLSGFLYVRLRLGDLL